MSRCAGGIFGRSPTPDRQIKGVGMLAAGWVSHKQIKASAVFLFRLIWKCHVVSKVELCFIHGRYAFTSWLHEDVEEPEAPRHCGRRRRAPLLFYCRRNGNLNEA